MITPRMAQPPLGPTDRPLQPAQPQQMMGQPISQILGGGNPINSQILQQWAAQNPQRPPGASDPQRQQLASLLARIRAGGGFPGGGAAPGGPGDAMGRTGGINPPDASPGMWNFMGGVPGLIGMGFRGLRNATGNAAGGATDPRSGQVRGGGTGHVGGGITAGGPR